MLLKFFELFQPNRYFLNILLSGSGVHYRSSWFWSVTQSLPVADGAAIPHFEEGCQGFHIIPNAQILVHPLQLYKHFMRPKESPLVVLSDFTTVLCSRVLRICGMRSVADLEYISYNEVVFSLTDGDRGWNTITNCLYKPFQSSVPFPSIEKAATSWHKGILCHCLQYHSSRFQRPGAELLSLMIEDRCSRSWLFPTQPSLVEIRDSASLHLRRPPIPATFWQILRHRRRKAQEDSSTSFEMFYCSRWRGMESCQTRADK